jgi:hypothetical protein
LGVDTRKSIEIAGGVLAANLLCLLAEGLK